jgi:hypothetical protein
MWLFTSAQSISASDPHEKQSVLSCFINTPDFLGSDYLIYSFVYYSEWQIVNYMTLN